MSSAKRSSEAQVVTMAFNDSGASAATCSELKPLQDSPIMPTLPSHQGCAAIQPITSTASRHSCGVYSSNITPSLSPEPRMSTRTQT